MKTKYIYVIKIASMLEKEVQSLTLIKRATLSLLLIELLYPLRLRHNKLSKRRLEPL
jgi:hypothetical protein